MQASAKADGKSSEAEQPAGPQGSVRVATFEWVRPPPHSPTTPAPHPPPSHSSAQGGNVKRLCRQCTDPPAALPCALIVASDVVGCGDASLFPPLVKTFRELSNSGGLEKKAPARGSGGARIIMSYKFREDFESEFFEQM